MSRSYSLGVPRPVRFLLTLIRFSTSSSKEVSRYIVPAGSVPFVSKVEAKKIPDPSKVDPRTIVDKPKETEPDSPPRDLRPRSLLKRIGRINFHLTCISWRDRTAVEEQDKASIDSKLTSSEIKYRRVSELTGSDLLSSPKTPLPRYDAAEHKTAPSISEMPPDSSPVELYSPPQESASDVYGGLDAFTAGKPQRRGAQRRRTRTSSSHKTPGTPIAELPGDEGQLYFPSTAAVNMPHAAWYTGPSSLDVSVEVCAQAVPDLSPQTTTRKSSLNSPETPVATDDFPTQFQESHTSFTHVVWPDGDTPPNQQFGIDESSIHNTSADSLFWDFCNSILVQNIDENDSLTLAAHSFENNYKHADVNDEGDWPQMGLAYVPSEVQPTIEPPPRSCTYNNGEEESIRQAEAVLGTWEKTGPSTWARVSGHEPACPDVDTKPSHHEEPSLEHEHRLSHKNHVQANLYISQAETSFATKKDYTPVNCDKCKKQYTGQYGLGNMKRHASQMHSLKPRRDNKCRFCVKVYNRSDALRAHERRAHPTLINAKAKERAAR